jgi:uncharacterized protein with HEPN domain
MKKREYRDYLKDILDSINDIESFVGDMSFEDFKRDKKTIYAVVRGIEVMGEAAKKIPKTLKDKYREIPWKKMAGMRDKLIHEYFGVDVEILWKTIKDDLPSVKPLVQELLESMGE